MPLAPSLRDAQDALYSCLTFWAFQVMLPIFRARFHLMFVLFISCLRHWQLVMGISDDSAVQLAKFAVYSLQVQKVLESGFQQLGMSWYEVAFSVACYCCP